MANISNNSFVMTASNYAKKFGVALRIQGCQAYTNGELINIPRFDYADSKSVQAAYAYIAHEAAHIKYTDFDVAKSCTAGVERDLLNILEDTRIEKLIGHEYVGVYENLCALNHVHISKHLQNVELLQSPKTLFLALVMDYAITLMQKYPHARAIAAAIVRESRRTLGRALTVKVMQIVQRMPYAATTANVMAIADELFRLLKDLLSQASAKQQTKSKSTKRKVGRQNPEATAIASDGLDLLSVRDAENGDKGIANAFAVGEASSEMIHVLENSGSRDDLGALSIGRCRPGDAAIETPEINALSRMLHRYIQTYVTTMQDAGTNGQRLNIKKAVKIPCGEDRIFKTRHLDLDHDTHVSILVDASGSMQAFDGGTEPRYMLASKCAYMMTRALSGISNVTRDCYVFPGMLDEVDECINKNTRLTVRTGFMFNQKPRGSTPLAQAIWASLRTLKVSPKNRNIIILITDGVPDSMPQAREALRHAYAMGVEVYGIAIKTQFLFSLFDLNTDEDMTSAPDATHNDHVVVVKDARELNTVAVKYLKKIFAVKNLEI